MQVIEWIVVGLLVAAAAAYAAWRGWGALKGRGGCAFISGDGPPCANCPGTRSNLSAESEDTEEDVKREACPPRRE
ncbi:MAG: hypothetical protein ACYTGB_10455 [Planctomycetota bacterium]|jgi:hypothetical protein